MVLIVNRYKPYTSSSSSSELNITLSDPDIKSLGMLLIGCTSQLFKESLNPFGENGVFGAKQQQRFKDTIKPLNDTVDKFNQWVDKSDKQEGFQANDPGDYARFAAKLVPGMIQGAANAPTAIGEAVSGVRTKDDGSKEKLSGAQRTGALADGVISTAGIPFGGSGTLVKGAKAAGKSIFANHASHQATKLAASNALRDLTKDALKEGAEEAIL